MAAKQPGVRTMDAFLELAAIQALALCGDESGRGEIKVQRCRDRGACRTAFMKEGAQSKSPTYYMPEDTPCQ